ncbi:radical SAM protein [Bacteroidota bacterium]
MATFLFDEIIFGPVNSRRLGISLGINLLPNDSKFCNFNCIYCECGLTEESSFKYFKLHPRDEIKQALEEKLKYLKSNKKRLDTITYAGNGEPTLHPSFAEIIDDTIALRDNYYPAVEIAVLSNATKLGSVKVFNALNRVEKNILKLDSAFEETLVLLNQPFNDFSIQETVNNLKKFKGNFILQTMFIQGEFKGIKIDNTTDKELDAWLKIISVLNPKEVMIYTIERDTPYPDIFKVSKEKLFEIADKVNRIGISTQVSE